MPRAAIALQAVQRGVSPWLTLLRVRMVRLASSSVAGRKNLPADATGARHPGADSISACQIWLASSSTSQLRDDDARSAILARFGRASLEATVVVTLGPSWFYLYLVGFDGRGGRI